MTYILVVSSRGVNDCVFVSSDQSSLLERVERWEPGFRLGRINFQDFGYKRGLVSENGLRCYEIFEAPATS